MSKRFVYVITVLGASQRGTGSGRGRGSSSGSRGGYSTKSQDPYAAAGVSSKSFCNSHCEKNGIYVIFLMLPFII